MTTRPAFHGVIPAMAVPFQPDYKIDADRLARFARWLISCRGVTAVMTNGHTGEVGSLLPDERADVTRIVADAVKGHEGHHVKLQAHVYADKSELHVMKVTMISEKGKKKGGS